MASNVFVRVSEICMTGGGKMVALCSTVDQVGPLKQIPHVFYSTIASKFHDTWFGMLCLLCSSTSQLKSPSPFHRPEEVGRQPNQTYFSSVVQVIRRREDQLGNNRAITANVFS